MRRILIVEDSATLRSSIVASLDELDEPCKIVQTASGFEALRQLPRAHFDLVISALALPDIDGLELVSFVKQNPRYASIPLVLVSTTPSECDRQQGLALGADAHLMAPLDPETLRQLVAGLLVDRQAER